jgi:dihydroorotate dehydrogenase electron transfer subunit
MKQFTSHINRIAALCEDMLELSFAWPAPVRAPTPGQFVTIRVHDGIQPLLRRPLAISDFDGKKRAASIIFQKRGPATSLLAAKSVGDELDVIGPLGNSFVMPGKQHKAIVIAGGIGLGPMLFLARTIARRHSLAKFIFGARTKALVPASRVFKGLSAAICTDDGSAGFLGTVMDYLRALPLPKINGAHLYACGPHPMLAACHQFAAEHDIPCHVSVEQVMACGVGACMGCVVKVAKGPGFARACTEGPVFEIRELIWE